MSVTSYESAGCVVCGDFLMSPAELTAGVCDGCAKLRPVPAPGGGSA